ncbi:MAG TPA: histidinol dehydrogenase [Candidatus Acidoferrum sp.]|nr:histidinol dehydrogenase [Candidatus Acidoferrum sp.]
MRILKLTGAVERTLLAARSRRDVQAEKVAAKIITDVRRRGDAALFSWAKKLDDINLTRHGMWVSQREIEEAPKSVSADFLRAVKHAIANVRKVAEKQLPRNWSMEVEPGVSIGQMVRPIETIGCYIPGGKSTLLSTLIMTAVPAQVAGAKRIVVACSKPNNELLAVAGILGLSEVARIGGAQAVAALAYGTKSIPRVDKIFGPGNRFVTAAKQLVSRDCGIDLPAGPTEAIVLASRGNPAWIAADLLAQAEHAPDAASILLTTSARLAREVQREVAEQLEKLPKANPASISLKTCGLILLAASADAAFTYVNRFAPEHLSLPQAKAAALDKISAAGTVFIGPWAAQPLGDYASGSNHVLPTGGWASRRGGLSAADFVKCITVQTIGRKGFTRLASDVRILAQAENLLAHENAVAVRE